MPETQARRALSGRPVLLRVLAPVGSYAGCGTLRVLRARPSSGPGGNSEEVRVELVCGYERYESFA